mgnify:CR=1 FL=1
MKLGSVRREIRILRAYALVSTLAAGAFLLGAVHEARTASFDTLTVHRINVLDREGKLAMVITNHDDFPPPIVNGKPVKRMSGNDATGIVFYNQQGDEQGALIWSGRIAKDGSFQSGATLSYDSAKTDQLLQVDDANDNGRQSAYVIGWNEPDQTTPAFKQFLREWQAATTDAQKRAVRMKYPGTDAPERFFFGYDDTQSRVTLHDATGRPRINMFVTNDGQAKLQFLDATGKVTYELPQ